MEEIRNLSQIYTPALLSTQPSIKGNVLAIDILLYYIYLIPFKIRLPLIFASRGAKIGGRGF